MTQIYPTNDIAAKKTILLADDDHSTLEALQYALTSENFDVLPASNSREALGKVSENQVDIALLDLDLGDSVSGWDTFRRLAEMQPLLPIVVMSAQPGRLYAQPLATRLPDASFEKPLLNLPVLFDALRRLTSTRCLPGERLFPSADYCP